MGVQGAFQRLTKYAGHGVVFGGALYYAVKEYGFPNFQRVDLLKDSYKNLMKSFNKKKLQDYCHHISANAIPTAMFGLMPNLHVASPAPNTVRSDGEAYSILSPNATTMHSTIWNRGSSINLKAEEPSKHDLYMGFLSKVPILENLTEAERHIVVDAMEPVSYKKGDILMKQGDPGEDFFIIIEGNVVCTQYAKQGETAQEVGHLGPSDYFGEIALLLNQPRRATVTVSSNELKAVRLDKKGFETVMGPCSNILRRHIQNYSSAISLKLSMPSF